jgi:hypothetical protein
MKYPITFELQCVAGSVPRKAAYAQSQMGAIIISAYGNLSSPVPGLDIDADTTPSTQQSDETQAQGNPFDSPPARESRRRRMPTAKVLESFETAALLKSSREDAAHCAISTHIKRYGSEDNAGTAMDCDDDAVHAMYRSRSVQLVRHRESMKSSLKPLLAIVTLGTYSNAQSAMQ